MTPFLDKSIKDLTRLRIPYVSEFHSARGQVLSVLDCLLPWLWAHFEKDLRFTHQNQVCSICSLGRTNGIITECSDCRCDLFSFMLKKQKIIRPRVNGRPPHYFLKMISPIRILRTCRYREKRRTGSPLSWVPDTDYPLWFFLRLYPLLVCLFHRGIIYLVPERKPPKLNKDRICHFRTNWNSSVSRTRDSSLFKKSGVFVQALSKIVGLPLCFFKKGTHIFFSWQAHKWRINVRFSYSEYNSLFEN